MHPKEAYKQKTGTGRLASLSLLDSEIIIDYTFDNNSRTQELISDPAYYPMVLYPNEEAHYAESFNFNEGVRLDILTLWPREYQNVKPDPVIQKLKITYHKL